jgi:hypothetical protein
MSGGGVLPNIFLYFFMQKKVWFVCVACLLATCILFFSVQDEIPSSSQEIFQKHY